MEIIYRKLSDMRQNPRNPRKSTQEAIEKLAVSIKANPLFFEARPILLSDRTGELVIIGGERRSKAAALLKMKTVPSILLTGLDEEEEERIMTLDNTHVGEWDFDKLAEIAAKWGEEKVASWGAPMWGVSKVDEAAVDALFQQSENKSGLEPIKVFLHIPADYKEEMSEIGAAVLSALSRWPGCVVKK